MLVSVVTNTQSIVDWDFQPTYPTLYPDVVWLIDIRTTKYGMVITEKVWWTYAF